MDTYYNKDYLVELNKKIILNNIEEVEINQFLSHLCEIDCFDLTECNIQLLIILSSFSPKTELQNCMLKTIKLKLITKYVIEYQINNCDCNNNLDFLTNNENIDKELNYQNIKDYYEKNIKSFKNNQDVTIPKPGKTMVVHYRDNTTFPGKEYLIDFLIDHNGDVLKMMTNPVEVVNDIPTFEDTYAGLVGQILNYQKVNNE